ncbi:MAG: 4Fe-4S dicluster domain-containing protein [Desulfobulbaceae bacterium]|nr:4Fe-4S dicluster domain-containing protein [Desulfobulbaceae bacterium]
MTNKYILKKDHLVPLLRQLGKEYQLVAPLENKHGDTLFTHIDNLDNCRVDLENQPQNSLKQFFFPQQEVLFRYRNQPGVSYEFEPAKSREDAVLYLGVRPCDLSAILYMDVVFLKDFKDPYYQKRRNNSVLVGLNCNTPFDNCFCNGTKSGPFIDYGFDLQLTDLGKYFLVESDRSRGEDILEKLHQFFELATEDDVKDQYQAYLESRGRFKRQVHVDLAMKNLAEGYVADGVWTELSERCQDCGGCAYICPTCVCFSIYDQQQSATEGERIRCWDACTFSGFTRMAGGHNPVDSSIRAIEQRFRHKLQFDVKKHGRPSCVGCGRCVEMCFGGTDIIRFINMACCEGM